MPSGLLLYVDGDNISGAGVELVTTAEGPAFRATSLTSGGFVTASNVAIGASGSLLIQFKLDNSADSIYVMDGETISNRDIFYQKGLGAGYGFFLNGNQIADGGNEFPQSLAPATELTSVLLTWDGTLTYAYKNGIYFTDRFPPPSTGSPRKLRFASRFNSTEGLVAGHILRIALFDRVLDSTERTNVSSLSWSSGDTTAPTLTGAITEVSKTENSISISWPAGSDNVAVTRYEVSTNGGSSWTDTGNTTLSRTFTGLTASTAYAIHVRAKDAAGNVSTPALTTSITTLAPDTTAPSFGAATLSAGTKTNSSIALSTSAVATDNVAVTGYEWSSDNGATYPFTSLSNSFTFTALTALTAYNFRVRAYDGAGNRSTHLSLTTSTYRAGDTGQFIIDNTGPVGGNPAGILYNDVVLPGDADKWFSFLITTPPANAGSLTIDPQGRFTWVGMSADSFYYQLEVEGANVGSPVLVSLGPAGPTPLNATKRTPNGMIGFWNR